MSLNPFRAAGSARVGLGEEYKPAAQRRWGYYVCPLLHRGRLVGRLEAHREGRRLVVDRLWEEAGQELDRRALDEALSRHEAGM